MEDDREGVFVVDVWEAVSGVSKRPMALQEWSAGFWETLLMCARCCSTSALCCLVVICSRLPCHCNHQAAGHDVDIPHDLPADEPKSVGQKWRHSNEA